MPATILFLASNPMTTSRLALGEEAREIREKLRQAQHRDHFILEDRWAVRPDDILQVFNELRPAILHISGHGDPGAGLVLHDAVGGVRPLTGDALRRVFEVFRKEVRLAVLNACFSEQQCLEIVEVIGCAIGMRREIGDEAARVFAASFYRALGFANSVKNAFDQGCLAMTVEGVGDDDVPQLVCRPDVDPERLFFIPSAVSIAPGPVPAALAAPVTLAASGALAISVAVAAPVAATTPVTLVAGGPDHDRDIDEARVLLAGDSPAAARELLQRKKARDWDKLSARQRYRLLANLAAAHLGLGERSRAAKLYLEASDHQPDDPDARALAAIGHELLGEKTKAFELAEGLVTNHRCRRAVSVYVRCAPPDTSVSALRDTVAPWLDEIDVLVSLCMRATQASEDELCLDLARRLDAEHPEAPVGPLLIGKTLLLREQRRLYATHRGEVTDINCEALMEAEERLTAGIARCQSGKHDDLKGDALVARANARGLLGKERERRDDIEQASRLIPDDPCVLLQRSDVLLQHDRPEGLRLLREAVQRAEDPLQRSSFSMLLAQQFATDPATLEEASQLFCAIAAQSAPIRGAAAVHAVDTLVKLGALDAAADVVRGQRDMGICFQRTLEAAIALARGQDEEGGRLAAEALETLQPDELVTLRRALALVLTAAGKREGALRVWRTLAVAGVASQDTLALIQCAYDLQDHPLVLEQCRLLRENGASSSDLIEIEAGLLQLYDPARCHSILREYVAAHPHDRRATLRYFLAAHRLGLSDEIVIGLDRLPAPDGNLHLAREVLKLLRVVDRPEEALRYAYEVLRAHWSEPDAHISYGILFQELPEDTVPTPSTKVAPGTAVRFIERPGSADRWLIIEDGPTIYPNLDEARPDSKRAAPFLDRSVGDVVTAAPGIQEHKVEIREIRNKYLHRFIDTVQSFPIRFPDRQDFQAIAMGPETLPPEQRFADVLRAGEERWHAVLAERPGGPAPGPVSLTTLSEALGEDPIGCQVGRGLSPRTEVTAADGPLDAYDAAVTEARTRGTLVLDVSAVATILLLDLTDTLAGLGWKLAMTYSTGEMVIGFAKKNRSGRQGVHIEKSPTGTV